MNARYLTKVHKDEKNGAEAAAQQQTSKLASRTKTRKKNDTWVQILKIISNKNSLGVRDRPGMPTVKIALVRLEDGATKTVFKTKFQISD